NPPSFIVDNTNGATWIANAQLNAVFSTVVYFVNWIYIGSESDRVDTFIAPAAMAAAFAEDNRNNNCIGCNTASPVLLPQLMGSATLQTAQTPGFTFGGAGSVSNGGNAPPNAGVANFVLSYATLSSLSGVTRLTLSSQPSDWVIIGFNDNAFADDNHDDFVVA